MFKMKRFRISQRDFCFIRNSTMFYIKLFFPIVSELIVLILTTAVNIGLQSIKIIANIKAVFSNSSQ